MTIPAMATINRILRRQHLVTPRPRKRPRDSSQRFERPAPMQLWQIDNVGGLPMVNPATGELWEAKLVTGVDDHSRFCAIAHVMARLTARAVCLALAQALTRRGVPEEVLPDTGKQRPMLQRGRSCRGASTTRDLPHVAYYAVAVLRRQLLSGAQTASINQPMV